MPRSDTRALMHHVLQQRMQKRHQYLCNAIRPASARRYDPPLDACGGEGVQMMETRIYIGLNDARTREQIHETGRYMEMLKDVCRSYHVAFSVDIENGGYYHEDGEYTEETSFVLVLIDTDRNTVQGIARDLCTLFHQESVLVTEDILDGHFLYGQTDPQA